MKLSLFAVAALAVASLSGCGFTTIDAGHVGIVVDNFGSKRGVQDYTLKTGFITYNPMSESIVEYPTYVQTVVWTKDLKEGEPADESITFTTKESMSVNADISLSYQLETQNVPSFYVKFRNDDLKGWTYGYLHNVSRDAFMEIGGHYTVEQVMGDNEKFLHEVRDRVQQQVLPFGVQVLQFGFIGSPRPPSQVIDSINAAEQAKYLALQKQNELAQTQAEAAKDVAKATGQAQANRVLAESITDKLLEKQRLDIQDRWIARWNGQTPSVTTGGGNMLMTLPVPNKQ